ncbi:unnamed protein product [Coffea canephora]|uniref:Uncharacterized protein n=1 Tax=Coffea canephora TaxID=49390 RepID=A0A068TS52_COFCA|nr:unnamed protein product [Coffea canephora]
MLSNHEALEFKLRSSPISLQLISSVLCHSKFPTSPDFAFPSCNLRSRHCILSCHRRHRSFQLNLWIVLQTKKKKRKNYIG